MRAGLPLLENETEEKANKLAILKRLAQEGFDDLEQGRGTELESLEELSTFVSELRSQGSKSNSQLSANLETHNC